MRRAVTAAPSLRDALVHVFYNRRMIVACLAGGLALGAAGALLTPPKFTAESLVLLRVGATEAAQGQLNGPPAFLAAESVQRVLQSDVQIVTSEPAVRAALSRLDPAGDGPSPAEVAKFRKGLRVGIEPQSNVMKIAFVSPDRESALRAVQAIMDAYAERRAGLYVNASRDRQDQEIDRYDEALRTTEADIQRTRQDHGVLDIERDVVLASDRLDALEQRAAQAAERRGVVAAELAAVQRSLASAPERVMDSQERTNSTPNDEARNTLLRLRQERAHVVEQYAEDWPGLKEIDARIAAAQAQIVENSQDIRSSDRTVRNPVADLLSTRRAGLVIEQASLDRQIGELAAQVGAARRRIDDLRSAEMRLHELERSRSASETIHRSLLIGRAGTSLEDQAVDDAHTTLRVVQPPNAPLQGRDLRPVILLGGLALGVAAAIAATVVRTLLRQVWLTPGDAAAGLSAPLLLTADVDRAADVGPRLAGLLLDTRIDGRPLQVVQIVGDGVAAKSRLGLGLCQALAARLGAQAGPDGDVRPVLLIDPDAASHYRKKAAQAFVRRLPDGGGGLEVARSMTPGLWAALDPAETAICDPHATADRARACLELLRGAFSRIVLVAGQDFDGPDARRLFPLADANLILVQAERTRTPAARRMVEVVLAAGGDLLGFVFMDRRRHIPEAIYRWL